MVNYKSAIIISLFYLICLFTPKIFTIFLRWNENREEPFDIDNFHKRNSLLFLFILLIIIGILLFYYVVLVVGSIIYKEGSWKETLLFASKSFAFSVWDDKTLNAWLAIMIALVSGYSIFSLYFVMSPKELKDKLMFPVKVPSDEDDVQQEEGDEDWSSKRLMYEMVLAYVMSLAIFTLSFMSLYGKTNVYYISAAIYICAILMVFFSVEYWWVSLITIIALTIPSFLEAM